MSARPHPSQCCECGCSAVCAACEEEGSVAAFTASLTLASRSCRSSGVAVKERREGEGEEGRWAMPPSPF